MITVSYHDCVNVLQGLSLQDLNSCQVTPFDRWQWYDLLAQAGVSPLIAKASNGENSAAIALASQDKALVAMRNWYNFTWRPITSQADDNALLRAIAQSLKSQTHRVTMEPVPDEDGSAHNLAQAFSSAGWSVRMEECDVNHILPVRGRDFDAYWQSRPGRLRTTLKRKAKKVSVEIIQAFDADAWAKYESIYQQSWKPTEDSPEMLRKFAQQESDAGRLRLGLALHEGEAVAAQFWTVENGVAYIHKLAHLESHKNLSAGTTLSAALFAHVIDQDKVALVDFGTGNDRYKADWMEEIRPRYRIDCINLRSPRAWLPYTKSKFLSLRK